MMASAERRSCSGWLTLASKGGDGRLASGREGGNTSFRFGGSTAKQSNRFQQGENERTKGEPEEGGSWGGISSLAAATADLALVIRLMMRSRRPKPTVSSVPSHHHHSSILHRRGAEQLGVPEKKGSRLDLDEAAFPNMLSRTLAGGAFLFPTSSLTSSASCNALSGCTSTVGDGRWE